MNCSQTLKARRLLTGAMAVVALVAVFAPRIVRANTNVYIWCSARILSPDPSEHYMSLEILEDPVYGVAHWNIGDIWLGGVADTWYDGGPGKFRIKNVGNIPAYVHIIAASADESMPHWEANDGGGFRHLWPTDKTPPSAPEQWGGPPEMPFNWYALAVAVNVLDVAPRWNVLNQFLDAGMYGGIDVAPFSFGRVLGKAQPGEHIVFDLKFWAPQEFENGFDHYIQADPAKLVRFEAADFPRWPGHTWVQ